MKRLKELGTSYSDVYYTLKSIYWHYVEASVRNLGSTKHFDYVPTSAINKKSNLTSSQVLDRLKTLEQEGLVESTRKYGKSLFWKPTNE